jgi:hypothetical protein
VQDKDNTSSGSGQVGTMLFSQVVQSSLPRIWQKMIGGYWLIVFRLAQSLRAKGRNRLFEERFLGTALHICIPGFGSATSSSWRHQAVETAPTLAKSLFGFAQDRPCGDAKQLETAPTLAKSLCSFA